MPPNKPGHPTNPHAAAAGAYGDHAQAHTPDQREVEARVLLKAAQFMSDLQEDWGNINTEVLEETLKYNRQIWLMFYDNALEDQSAERPGDLRSNIINLSNYVFKREMEILASPDRQKLNVLININREIAAGLMTRPPAGQGGGKQGGGAPNIETPQAGGTSTSA